MEPGVFLLHAEQRDAETEKVEEESAAMTTHRIQDNTGRWHRVSKSTSTRGSYVSFYRGEPSRLWRPGQFKAVEVTR